MAFKYASNFADVLDSAPMRTMVIHDSTFTTYSRASPISRHGSRSRARSHECVSDAASDGAPAVPRSADFGTAKSSLPSPEIGGEAAPQSAKPGYQYDRGVDDGAESDKLKGRENRLTKWKALKSQQLGVIDDKADILATALGNMSKGRVADLFSKLAVLEDVKDSDISTVSDMYVTEAEHYELKH
ncbi:hypothetical protein K461DRAFT_53151 [Myriangium duriaei CBS 260.36]|uniref:Uncharacterized protein n=1 Tax=Myriangium duriaei CBS 260.36 TaxID=1168546 RepID=A0A9P4MIH2_9PEZI|nr:hypothetical protein K461DRAFT_53151 [Myriangium duriaei CBS 260.36]